MRVINEIIGYLWRAGPLSAEDMTTTTRTTRLHVSPISYCTVPLIEGGLAETVRTRSGRLDVVEISKNAFPGIFLAGKTKT